MASTIPIETAARGRMRYLRCSPQKVRLVIDLVRGKTAEQALQILRFSNKGVSKDLYKLLYSAISNAREKGSDERDLVVARAYVDPGPSLKRIRANSMGRAFRVLHRTSHVTFELGVVPGKRTKSTAPTAPGAKTAKSRTTGSKGEARPA